MSVAIGGREPAAPDVRARPCLLINPASFRASRWGLARRARTLAAAAGVDVVELAGFERFRATLDQLRAERRAEVWVLSGDGTVHAVAEYLADLPAGEWSPAWLFLGGGRANIVPRDCGGYPPMRRLRAAVAAHRAMRALPEQSLQALRVRQEGATERQGFLFAGAMIHQGIQACRAHRARGTGWIHRSWIADPLALLRLALQVWTGRSPLAPCEQGRVETAEGLRLAAPLRVLLASTLALRDAPYNPFAARGAGPVRVTAIARTAPHFWRHLPRLLGGRFGNDMDLAQGILSGRTAWAEVTGITGYSLDGEPFAADPSRPVRLEAGVTLRVLRP